ncbi:RUS family member 1 isoform X2 [Sinocyclocheilus rhinocerous]|nr:PREDICTED: RUS1 family protein C16orf58 homolog isoform X2 [Sinocyclocheilus rhinocerous]XP_016395464.1 PREDICTED: RUS1 family protein C16orf58 homolog isoform X2 [Sinocyclocheilus rhinocerous]XP_016395465.1 PREDICTED: RUS1 family protein C16orf58 homolog isoform X2 [Sinocyclocheilus rhinocerous]XP_016395466.1 PREDICTED: RUS1 family protein C16orf58 homolog isoform X2 [Sinocyclocheilus rhinocerous]XP_016395467.1 PREDICTED: RUS1 family protein C16orf58 homolog isoform X2 [Sinocyclocheilus rhi
MAEMEDCEGVIATERYGSQESWKYLLKDGRMKRQKDALDGRLAGNSISGVFKSVFLPQGYPESVSEDYVQYQLWDTVQAFSSSLSGTLATQASLRGVGVGNQEATVAAATITWLLRDGTGMLGRILFAWLKGSKLDSEAKKWRLFADILNDVAMFMEIAAPHFPPFFTLIVCIAGIFKSIVGVAGGATRAALTVHQARRNNMADISAKDGSQETLVNLAGLLVSLALIPLVTDNPLLTFILFFLFTVLHLFANYKAVRSVVMETLNEARLSIVLHQYLLHGQLLSPVEANQKEPVFLSLGRTVPIKLGVRLGDIVQEPGELQLALKNNSKPYLIGIKNGTVCVCLGSDASVRDEIMAACQALCLRAVLHDDSSPSGALKQLSNTKDPWDLVSQSHKMINQIIQTFLKELDQAKWQTDWTLLDWNEWRVEWSKKRS